MSDAHLYLASTSPRRQELLRQIQVRFEVLPVHVNETPLSDESPEAMVARLALAKACAGLQQPARTLPLPVLAADTAVVVDGVILGKPADDADARHMLAMLSGRCHQVYSGIALVSDAWQKVRGCRSEVCFREMSAAEIHCYSRTGECRDKAGAYGIQGLAAVFVERLHGSYSSVMGLPLHETASLLEEAGLDFWLTEKGVR